MKKLYTLLLMLIGISGFSQVFNPTNGPAAGMADCKFVFVEGDLLFADYGDYLIRSDNGGADWYIVTANFPNIEIWPSCMIRKDDYLFMGTGFEQRCYRSNDNGDTWETINTGLPTQNGFQSCNVHNMEVSGDNIILTGSNFTGVSSDMGMTWQAIEDIDHEISYAVNKLPSGIYISTSDYWLNYAIYKSLDGGISWNMIEGVPYIEYEFAATQYQNTAEFAEMNGKIYSAATLNGNGLMRTVDNGATWENVGNFWSGRCIRNYDGVLYFTDNFGAYKSADEGVSWEQILDASWFTNDVDAGYINRADGKIWITTGKGPVSYDEVTAEISNSSIPNASLSNMIAKNGVILGTQEGQLYISTDYGFSWANITANIAADANVLNINIDGSGFFVCALSGGLIYLYKSTDNGATWTTMTTAPGGGGGTAFFSYNPQFYAKGAGADLTIWKSMDDGATWYETSLDFQGDPLAADAKVQGFEKHGDLLFADIKNGFAYSSDAGETWTVRPLDSDGKVVGWPGKFVRIYDMWGTQKSIRISTDNGATWVQSVDGFPTLAGFIQGPEGMGMVDGRVYIQNPISSTIEPENAGYYYYMDEESTSWTINTSLGQLPYIPISITGTSESDLYVSTFEHGVWTNAISTGIVEPSRSTNSVKLFPNPASSTLTMDCDLVSGNLRIIDISGRVVMNETYINGGNQLSISSLKPGMYILQINDVSGNFQGKFIKN